MNVAVVGTGYVGLVAGSCLADMGHNVGCHDVDAQRIQKLREGEIPFFEPGLSDIVKRNVRDGRLQFSAELGEILQGTAVCFVAVGTPPKEDGSADIQAVCEAAEHIADKMQGPLTIVIKSTVPVGTCENIYRRVKARLTKRVVDFAFDVVSNPEFLREGKAVEDFMRPDRIVIGSSNKRSADQMTRLYASFVRNGHPLLHMNIASSEISKYASNSMLATRISLMNEVAQICEKVGADIQDVRRSVGTDQRIGNSYLYAGAGFGGSCLPKDIRALASTAESAGVNPRILRAVELVNDFQKTCLADRVLAHFDGNVKTRILAIWGLAFKPLTDDTREAPAFATMNRLLDNGASIVAYDPEATRNAKPVFKNRKVVFAKSPYEAVQGADALILMTEWGVFRGLDMQQVKTVMKHAVLFDGRNLYDPDDMRSKGFEYHCIGRAGV